MFRILRHLKIDPIVLFSASGSVMGQILQPHYGHIPYTLQFMMDYNLQGMSLIHVKIAQFRHPNLKVTYESQDVCFWSDASKGQLIT